MISQSAETVARYTFPVRDGSVGTVEDRGAGHEQVGAGREQSGGVPRPTPPSTSIRTASLGPNRSKHDDARSSVGDRGSVAVAKAD